MFTPPSRNEGFTMSNRTPERVAEQGSVPDKPRRPRAPRPLLVAAAVAVVVGTAFAYPSAAVPIGLGLTMLELLRRRR
jgi:hypothetical protein